MKTDEILKSFDTLMWRKNQRKLSGGCESKAYKEQAKLLREHYHFALSSEKRAKE